MDFEQLKALPEFKEVCNDAKVLSDSVYNLCVIHKLDVMLSEKPNDLYALLVVLAKQAKDGK